MPQVSTAWLTIDEEGKAHAHAATDELAPLAADDALVRARAFGALLRRSSSVAPHGASSGAHVVVGALQGGGANLNLDASLAGNINSGGGATAGMVPGALVCGIAPTTSIATLTAVPFRALVPLIPEAPTPSATQERIVRVTAGLADATAAVLALGAIAGLALDGVGSIGASKERKAPPRPRVCIVAGQNCGRASTFAQVADAAFGCQIVLLTDEEVVIPRAPETWSIVRRVQDAADHGPFAAIVTLPMERDGSSSSEGEELADVAELISRYTVAPGGHIVCFDAAVEGPGLRRAARLAGVSVHDFAFGSWLTSPWAGGQLRAALAVAAALLWEGGVAPAVALVTRARASTTASKDNSPNHPAAAAQPSTMEPRDVERVLRKALEESFHLPQSLRLSGECVIVIE
jgi:hypothetical protein